MSFWNKLFGAKTKTDNSDEKSKFLPEEKEAVEITFAKKFTEKGGKFIQTDVKSLEQINMNETIVRAETDEYKFETKNKNSLIISL